MTTNVCKVQAAIRLYRVACTYHRDSVQSPAGPSNIQNTQNDYYQFKRVEHARINLVELEAPGDPCVAWERAARVEGTGRSVGRSAVTDRSSRRERIRRSVKHLVTLQQLTGCLKKNVLLGGKEYFFSDIKYLYNYIKKTLRERFKLNIRNYHIFFFQIYKLETYEKSLCQERQAFCIVYKCLSVCVQFPFWRPDKHLILSFSVKVLNTTRLSEVVGA